MDPASGGASRRALMAVVVVALLGLAGCGGSDGDGPADGGDGAGLSVVATTAVLGETAAEIVGDLGSVETLMEAGADPHSFEPAPAQVARLREADLVVANGLGLEEGLLDALDAARTDGATVIEVAPQVDPRPYSQAAGGGDAQSDGSAATAPDGVALDPHFWLDPVRMAAAAEIIGEELADAVPAVAAQVRGNAAAHADRLRELHDELAQILSAVPPARRVLVTNHDALGYLAGRYGFEIVGTVVPGGSTLADASSRDVAELVETMRARDVRVIFTDATVPDRVARAVRAELGPRAEVVALFTGSLAESDGGAATYIETMRTNAERIAAALSDAGGVPAGEDEPS